MTQSIQNIQTVAEFKQLISESNQPVVVDFWAPWCGPCKALGPILQDTADTLGDEAVIVKINIDTAPELAQAHQITSIPTLLFYKNGELAHRQSGIVPKDAIIAQVRKSTACAV